MDSFLSSLVPEPYQVLGVLLRPLSFGHVVLLSRLELDPLVSPGELALAVQICSRPFSEGVQFIDKATSPAGFAALEKFATECSKRDTAKAFEAWIGYLEAHSSAPEYFEAEKGETKRGAPFLAQMRVWLLGRCNYSPEYIMDAPFGQCLWDYGASVEESAGEGIVGDKHREIEALLEAARN